jgi:hypothetical protein
LIAAHNVAHWGIESCLRGRFTQLHRATATLERLLCGYCKCANLSYIAKSIFLHRSPLTTGQMAILIEMSEISRVCTRYVVEQNINSYSKARISFKELIQPPVCFNDSRCALLPFMFYSSEQTRLSPHFHYHHLSSCQSFPPLS